MPQQTAAQTGEDQRRQVTDQKLKLLDSILRSARLKRAAEGSDPTAKVQAEKVNRLVQNARALLAANEYEAAGKALDEALRASSAIASGGSQPDAGGPNIAAQRTQNAELIEQIRSYRGSLQDAMKDPSRAQAAAEAMAKIDRLLGDAEKQAAIGRYGDANKTLSEGYRFTVAAVSNVRAGQTVVLSLKFDTPADEYAYEQSRIHSQEMLVDLMLAEGRADGAKKDLVDRYVDESGKLKTRADGQARTGDYASAVKTMEHATAQLMRALQVMGLPVY